MKIVFDLKTGEVTTEVDGEVIEAHACYDIKLRSENSESRYSYWPVTKKARQDAERIYRQTGTKPQLT